MASTLKGVIFLARDFVKGMAKVNNPQLDKLIKKLAEIEVMMACALQPTNVDEVKRRWLYLAKRNKFSEPMFVYDESTVSIQMWKERALSELQAELRAMPPAQHAEEGVLRHLVQQCIKDKLNSLAFLRLFTEGDSAALREAAIVSFGRPSHGRAAELEAWLRAESLRYESPCMEAEALLNLRLEAPQVQMCLEWALRQYGLADAYVVSKSEWARAISVARFATEAKPGKIMIPATRSVNGVELLRAIGRVVECRILDAENARTVLHGMPSSDGVVSRGRALTSDAELEEYFLGEVPTLRDAARLTIMADQALQGKSFGEIAQWADKSIRYDAGDLRNPLETAWGLALRVMQGCRDGGNPYGYAFTKECQYYAGYTLVQDFEKPAWLACGLSLPEDQLTALSGQFSLKPADLPWENQGLIWDDNFREKLFVL